MQIRTFRVPFAEVVGDEATELEFGPDDYLVVRPLFAMPREESAALADRIREVERLAEEASELGRADRRRGAAEAAADKLVVDVIGLACVEWHLTGTDGQPIPKPGTPQALDTLPVGLASALYPFLMRFRGNAPNPGTRS